jgi:Flp pilus assembly pilin Flp
MLRTLWSNDDGRDIAEYAVMLAVILVLVIGTVRLIGQRIRVGRQCVVA